jgi:hypothetical protein
VSDFANVPFRKSARVTFASSNEALRFSDSPPNPRFVTRWTRVEPEVEMAHTDNYLVIFYCVSAGQNGPELGNDEEEIVLMVYWVVDLHSNQVR